MNLDKLFYFWRASVVPRVKKRGLYKFLSISTIKLLLFYLPMGKAIWHLQVLSSNVFFFFLKWEKGSTRLPGRPHVWLKCSRRRFLFREAFFYSSGKWDMFPCSTPPPCSRSNIDIHPVMMNCSNVCLPHEHTHPCLSSSNLWYWVWCLTLKRISWSID